MSVAEDTRDAPRPCGVCETDNPAGARFCKSCGAALAPPPACPACSAEVPEEARFCPGCGARLIGARPVAVLSGEGREPPPAPPAPAPREPEPPPKAATDAERVAAEVAAAADALPATRRPSSNVGTNVLVFVAILMVLLVAIYQMNKDAKKEISPFQGGPPPSQAQTEEPAAPAAQGGEAAAAPAAEPIRGVVKLPEGVAAPKGTLFVIVRNAGVGRGPPLAVKKIDAPTFPFEFEVGPGDVMMKGMPFNGPFDVQARLDADGNAMTKAPGDLVASEPTTGVQPGARVEVLLDERL